MKTTPQFRCRSGGPITLFRLSVALFTLVAASCLADEESDLLSGLTILSAVEDIHPDGSKTRLYKIVPPPPKPQPVVATPPAPEPVLTPEQQAAYLAEAQRRSGGTWSFGGTVYPTSTAPVTQLRWQHEGLHYEAWSRIDFNLLRSIGHLDVEGRYHSFFLMIGTQDTAPPDLTIPPALSTAPEGFVITEGDPANTAALAGLRLLHQHHDAHRAELVETARLRELREEAHRNAPKPPKKDTVIIYTDIQSKGGGGQ